MKLHEFVDNLNNKIKDKSVDASDFLFKGVSEFEKLVSSGDDHQVAFHSQALQRNLGLEVDPGCGDGDCAFSSITRELYKLAEFKSNRTLNEHLHDIGLGVNEVADAFTLRQRFVDHVQANEYYQLLSGIPSERLNDETEFFREGEPSVAILGI